MKPYFILVVILAVVVGAGGGGYWWLQANWNANEETPDLVETPPSVNTVNSLPLADRPFVRLIPHSDTSQCDGVDMVISHLKNSEQKVEYELEYTTDTLIQGVFGRREFTAEEKKHDPLLFGTCSSGKCRCDKEINGGSLKLSFAGMDDYVVKGDFNAGQVGDGALSSKDVRLAVDFDSVLPSGTQVIIGSSFGLPEELRDKVVLGPYYIAVEDTTELDEPVTATLQSKDASRGKVQLWDGETWRVLESKIDGDVVTFEIDTLGTIVLTE